MNERMSSIEDLEIELADKITKAKALCDEVLTQYCTDAKADLFSENEQEHANAYNLCRFYPIWSMLLYCAFDLLTDAEKINAKLAELCIGEGR